MVHEPIATVAAAEPDIRAVRALAARVREIIAPPVRRGAATRGAEERGSVQGRARTTACRGDGTESRVHMFSLFATQVAAVRCRRTR